MQRVNSISAFPLALHKRQVTYSSAVGSPPAAALLLASLRLRDCRWRSTHVGQRVSFRMAGRLQFRHFPSSLAFCRRSWARHRLYSLRSGVLLLACSYSRRSCRVPLVLAKGVSWGVLSPLSWWTRLFGFGEPLVPAFGSFWVFGSAFLPGPAALEGFLIGVLIVAVILVRPGGILGEERRVARRPSAPEPATPPAES